jgi:arylsulfatase A-like enzyme
MNRQPNLILIVMDSVRVANLSCYGYPRATTPHIDTLAAQSTLFENAFSVGCWTLPVHASLFTGLHSFSHGVKVSKDALPKDFPTLAIQLKELGYQTASFSDNAYISDRTGLTNGFDTVYDIWQLVKPHGIERTKSSKLIKKLEPYGAPAKPVIAAVRTLQHFRSMIKPQRRQGDKGARLTNQFLREWLTESRNPTQPFFLFVNYMECHEPYRPPNPYDRRFMPRHFSEWRVSRLRNNKEAILNAPDKQQRDDLEILQALYDGGLSYLDAMIGEVIQTLESLGILDETVVVVTSDHGDSLGEHHHIGHRMALYEQLVHVPLIIRYPRGFPTGKRVPDLVSLIDLYPTFLELGGADISGASLNGNYKLSADLANYVRPFVIAENTAPKSQNGVIARMLRNNQYKYIWKSNQEHELYDILADPQEQTNLISTRLEVAAGLNEQLQAWLESPGHPQFEAGQVEYDQVMLERLRELGYVD